MAKLIATDEMVRDISRQFWIDMKDRIGSTVRGYEADPTYYEITDMLAEDCVYNAKVLMEFTKTKDLMKLQDDLISQDTISREDYVETIRLVEELSELTADLRYT